MLAGAKGISCYMQSRQLLRQQTARADELWPRCSGRGLGAGVAPLFCPANGGSGVYHPLPAARRDASVAAGPIKAGARLPLNLLSPREQNSILPSRLKKLAPAMGILAFLSYMGAFMWSLNVN